MVNERLELALEWCKKNKIESTRLKKFNRESKKKRSKKKNCNSYTLSITLHPSWLDNLNLIKNFLYSYFDENCNSQPAYKRKRYINLPQDDKSIKKEYELAEMYIGYRPLLNKIKEKAINLNLPFMERKLGKIKVY